MFPSHDLGGGGGGGGSEDGVANSAGGNGGSGVVVLRYPNSFSISTSGLTTGGEQTSGSDKYIVITGGVGGTVEWS